jgi:hypothetical protein
LLPSRITPASFHPLVVSSPQVSVDLADEPAAEALDVRVAPQAAEAVVADVPAEAELAVRVVLVEEAGSPVPDECSSVAV